MSSQSGAGSGGGLLYRVSLVMCLQVSGQSPTWIEKRPRRSSKRGGPRWSSNDRASRGQRILGFSETLIVAFKRMATFENDQRLTVGKDRVTKADGGEGYTTHSGEGRLVAGACGFRSL